MHFHEMCPKYQSAMGLLGKRWTGLILRALIEGPRRFTDIRTYVEGLSDRLLSERLQELEEAGIVERTVFPGPPVTVEYALTEKGRSLRPVLEALQRWADQWIATEAVPSAPTRSPGVSRRR